MTKTSVEIKAELTSLEARKAENRKALDEATKTLRTQSWEIDRKISDIQKPYEAADHRLYQEIEAANAEYHTVLAEEKRATWATKLPDLTKGDEIREWFRYSAVMEAARKKGVWDIDYCEILGRQPKSSNPEIQIIALGDSSETIYLAFSKGALKSWMHITKPEHAGSSADIETDITANLYTKPLHSWMVAIGAKEAD
jgi:hypothetical protein